MVGNLLARARQDAKKIVTNLGFQNDVFLINPMSMAFIQLKGLTSKHWIKFDTDGSPINAKNVHLNLVEEDIQALGFETRGKNGNVKLIDYYVIVQDSTNVYKNYQVKEVYPNESLGLIVFILGNGVFNTPEEIKTIIDEQI